MPAPKCHPSLGELHYVLFFRSTWSRIRSIIKGPGRRGIVDGLRLSCVACVWEKRDTEPNYISAGEL